MSDDTLETLMVWGLCICAAILILLTIVGIIGDARLYSQCRDDGLKEYECVSMLRGRGIK